MSTSYREDNPPTDCPICHTPEESLTECSVCKYDAVCPVHGCTNPTCAAASRLMKPVPADAEWVTFCKRTEDPKLAWIEHQLDLLGLPHKRDGSSFHASHVLKVLASDEEQANTVLMRRIGRYTVDDVRDDHPRWTRELGLDNSLRM